MQLKQISDDIKDMMNRIKPINATILDSMVQDLDKIWNEILDDATNDPRYKGVDPATIKVKDIDVKSPQQSEILQEIKDLQGQIHKLCRDIAFESPNKQSKKSLDPPDTAKFNNRNTDSKKDTGKKILNNKSSSQRSLGDYGRKTEPRKSDQKIGQRITKPPASNQEDSKRKSTKAKNGDYDSRNISLSNIIWKDSSNKSLDSFNFNKKSENSFVGISKKNILATYDVPGVF